MWYVCYYNQYGVYVKANNAQEAVSEAASVLRVTGSRIYQIMPFRIQSSPEHPYTKLDMTNEKNLGIHPSIYRPVKFVHRG